MIFGGQFNRFVWPCVAFWALDRLIRLARIIYSSVLPRLLKNVRATATYDKQSEMIRLDVTDFIRHSELSPGLFYYIYAPGALRGYESHPMTLCSWSHKVPSSPGVSSVPSLTDDKDHIEAEGTTYSLSSLEDSENVSHSFLIRPYQGFTGRLREKITASTEAQASCQITVLLEGPYGRVLDLTTYSNVLTIVGGSGITAAVSHTNKLLRTESTAVKIVWAVPQRHLVDDVAQHELGSVLGHPRLDMEVYLTEGAIVEDKALEPQGPYRIHFGRPNILAAMTDARRKCSTSLAIVSCGTPPMSDACRRAVVELLKEPGAGVGYFDETMTW